MCNFEVEIFLSTIFIQIDFAAFAAFAMFAHRIVLCDFPFNGFVCFEKRENEIRVTMQTCKRCKRFKELSKREEVQVGQFVFCLLDFTP